MPERRSYTSLDQTIMKTTQRIKKPLLQIKNLALVRDGKKIAAGIDMTVLPGEIHVVMGPNGSGKSTLALSLFGHPGISITKGRILFKGKDFTDKKPEERYKAGMFLAFQQPPSIDGLSAATLIKRSLANLGIASPVAEMKARVSPSLGPLKIDPAFLDRQVNVEMSGGEKKKNEILQLLAASPEVAILDEIDSGLDIPAIKAIAKVLDSARKKGTAFIIITHYERLLKYLKPDAVHIINGGKIVFSGKEEVFKKIERNGFDSFLKISEEKETKHKK